MLDPARLRQRVTIMRETTVDDGKGGHRSTFEEVATVRAEVLGLIGREAMLSDALQGIASYKLTIRYRRDFEVRPADQIKYGSIDLNIRSVADPWGTGEALLIIADTASARPTP